MASVLVGVLATAMFSPSVTPAQGAVPTGAPLAAARADANQTVLDNEFGTMTSRVAGSFGKRGTVTGSFEPQRFKVTKAGRLKVIGDLTATMTRGSGAVVGTTTEQVALVVKRADGAAVARAAGSCKILNLVLGPLDLDLLGLQVHLDRVVLDIVAVPGPGNLLGNLLCAVAGLLDRGGLRTEVANILNAILAILRL